MHGNVQAHYRPNVLVYETVGIASEVLNLLITKPTSMAEHHIFSGTLGGLNTYNYPKLKMLELNVFEVGPYKTIFHGVRNKS